MEAERDFYQGEVERLRAREAEQARTEAALREEAAYVRLLQRVAEAANASPTADAAMRACLDLVCAHTGWPVGHVYALSSDPEELVPTRLWHIDDPERFEVLREVTERMRPALVRSRWPSQVSTTVAQSPRDTRS